MDKIKQHITNTFSNIDFIKKHHIYVRKEIEYISTTMFISRLHRPFDKDRLSNYVAKRDGKSVKEVLEEWGKKKKESLIKGNNTHDFAEKYFYDRTIKPNTKEEYNVVSFYNSLDQDRYKPLFAEQILFSDKFMLAGTTDLLLYDTCDKSIIIVDWKTNKDLFKSYNNLLDPFKHLRNSNFNKYKLQLSTYQLMLEEYDIKVSNRIIVWLSPSKNHVSINTESYTNDIKNYITS